MFTPHQQISTPADEVTVWRYMSIEKFISLLSSSSLHFCRLDKFDDPWEGVWPKNYLESASQKSNLEVFARVKSKHILFVNCWHANESESAAMWDLYSSRDSGVAIKTTVGRLKSSLEGGETYLGAVRYVDFNNYIERESLNVMVPAFLKRSSFEHEREVRLLHFKGELLASPPEISQQKVCLSTLMQHVYFSPVMPQWTVNAVLDVAEKFGVPRDVFIQSNLYNKEIL